MAYDEDLADRLRELVASESGTNRLIGRSSAATRRSRPVVTERRMFGGLAFLLDGNMAVSASGRGGLMVRVDPATSDDLVADPRAERMVMKGRPMDGWLRVDAAGLDDAGLAEWVARGVAYARSLAPK
jgi:TfoX/Sxy family transcriptional regulator of competence genes